MELSIKDDGVGIPEGSDIKKSKSFGYKIINAFVQKLNATLFIINENGLNVNIKIPQSK
jgi:two-component sensor histidine kinase